MSAVMRWTAAVLLVTGLAGAALGARAEGPAALEASFVLAEAPARARQRIDAAIDGVVDRMSFVIRPFARERLRGKNPVHRAVSASVHGERITVTYDGDRFETVDGRWAEVTAGGERVQLLQQRVGEHVVQTFRGGDGEKHVVLRRSEDGRAMTLDVTVTSPRLPEPLRYRLRYRSVPPRS